MQDQSTPQTDVQVAWAAGLFEGEGCFHTSRRDGGKVNLQIKISMTDADAIERFASIMGCGRRGRRHTAVHRARGDKPLYEWRAYSAHDVIRVIDMLLPYLCARRTARALEVRAAAETIRPAWDVRTHCTKGHELTEDNVIREPIKRGDKDYVSRRCRECRRIQSRERARRRLGIKPENFRVTEP